MMNKHDYKQAMNSIKISDSFKIRTAQLMREERDKNSAEASEYAGNYTAIPEKRRFTPFLRYGGIVLTAVAVIAAAGVYSASRSANIADTTGADSQPAEAAAPPQTTVMLYKSDGSGNDSEIADKYFEEEVVDDAADDSADAANDYEDSYDNDAASTVPETFAGKGDEASGGEIMIAEVPVEVSPSAEFKNQIRLADFIAENADAKFSGDAEIVQYMLADSNEKRPNDMPSEFAQIDEFPYDVIKTIADAENTGEVISYIDPVQYAGAKELYSSIGWDGYALTMNFRSGDASFSFTVCGDNITNNDLLTTYRLTSDQFSVFAELAKSQLGIDLHE